MSRPFFLSAQALVGIAAAGLVLATAVLSGSPARAQGTGTTPAAGAPDPGDADDEELFDPSDTGYLDSAVIRNQVRVRLDAASGADRPDRAEFIYGKCSCFTIAAGQDSASIGAAQNLDFQELELAVEWALGSQWSIFVEAPFRRTDLTLPEFFQKDVFMLPSPEVRNSGLGDLRLGFKRALVAQADRWVTFQLRAFLPTGDAAENLGTDHASLEPAILYYARLSERWTFASEVRWWYPLSGSSDPATGASDPMSVVGRREPPVGSDPVIRNDGFAGDIIRFGLGASYEGRGSRVSVSPIVELVGWHVLDGYATPPTLRATRSGGDFGFVEEAGGTTILNLKLGARIHRGGSDSVYVGYGAALTSDVWYDDVLRVEYRRTF